MIKDVNKEKRLLWCKKMTNDHEPFDDVIFTDESSVMLETLQEVLSENRWSLKV